MPPREGASLRQDFYQRRENGCHLSMSLAMGGSITNRGKASCCESDRSCLPRVGLPQRDGRTTARGGIASEGGSVTEGGRIIVGRIRGRVCY